MFLPPEAPLEMRAQSLAEAPPMGPRPPTRPRALGVRRLLVIGGAVLMTLAACREMYLVLNGAGPSPLGILVLVLFAALFAWIALAFTSAVAGFFSLLAGGGLGLGIARNGKLPELEGRTALLMPVYNESPSRVMGGLIAMIESLAATGRGAGFDVFILSDTTVPEVWIEEEAAFLAARASLGPILGEDGPRLFYRRRPINTERKAGNVAEWVRRWGAAYPQMMTLDADSIMEGESLVRLAAAMQANPTVGLIQTLPVIVGGKTLFARMQQFAGSLYGPLIAYGIAWWHGSEGNYWGHNAIIRTKAFAAHAGLPSLPGRKPFGGHILSHDFVEAALLRRAGWAVHMVPGLPGSYEESPPSLTDIAIRDRRWCQGNLQHAKVLPARGLHWISRLHLLMGIGSYVTSPLWLIFLLAGILISLQQRFVRPEYFGATKSLFPNWPQVDPVLARYVFIGTMAILLAPKLMAWLTLLASRRARLRFGGLLRALVSVLIETLIGGLIAPVAMLIQTGAVAGILAGRDSGWNAQRRVDGRVSLRQVWASYWRYMAFGLALALIAWSVSVPLFLWMSPVLLGLMLAVPLSALTGDRAPGLLLQRLGLLRIPEEVARPAILTRAASLAAELEGRTDTGPWQRLLADPELLAAHCAMLPPPRRRGAAMPIDADLVVGLARLEEAAGFGPALASLSAPERRAVLGHPDGVSRLAALYRAETVGATGASEPPSRTA